jgi:hypothetical protein
MNLKFFLTIVFAFLMNLHVSYSQENFSSAAKAILQTEKQIVEAVIKTDTLTVSSLLATGYTYTLPDGKIITKKQFISDIAIWWRPLSIDHSEQKVVVYDKAAIVTGKAKYRWKNKKEEVEEAIEQYTDTYIKLKGRWVRVSSHASCLSGRCT